MKKPLFSALYIFSLFTAGLTIHQAFAQRAPSVEPITEVSIEENKPTAKEGTAEKGFDFASRSPAVSEVTHEEMKRVPANIASKSSEHSTPYSYIGPMIFLLALPLALWIVVSKKMKGNEGNEKVDYYSKTVQFKPYKTEYQETDIDDEDQNYPKAS